MKMNFFGLENGMYLHLELYIVKKSSSRMNRKYVVIQTDQ